ncbi:hypothetical protein AB0D59_49110 [Streptomyces sp. NPDC048417]|uniref:hypothetical protein n=1 Tax=Streptomyces sp. NPDC048417 TaxID=3155387 RepID=UPI0034262E16
MTSSAAATVGVSKVAVGLGAQLQPEPVRPVLQRLDVLADVQVGQGLEVVLADPRTALVGELEVGGGVRGHAGVLAVDAVDVDHRELLAQGVTAQLLEPRRQVPRPEQVGVQLEGVLEQVAAVAHQQSAQARGQDMLFRVGNGGMGAGRGEVVDDVRRFDRDVLPGDRGLPGAALPVGDQQPLPALRRGPRDRAVTHLGGEVVQRTLLQHGQLRRRVARAAERMQRDQRLHGDARLRLGSRRHGPDVPLTAVTTVRP